MRNQRSILALVGLLMIFAVTLTACGGGSGSSTDSASAPRAESANQSSEPGSVGTGGASSFLKPNNPNNKYAKFGEEAAPAVRQAVSEVLAKNLKAREGADFAGQCESLAAPQLSEIAGVKEASKAAAACPKALKELAEPLSSTKEVRKDTLLGPIDAFRVKGSRGFALYHGNDGKDWMMPMVEERGGWKVGSIVTTEIG